MSQKNFIFYQFQSQKQPEIEKFQVLGQKVTENSKKKKHNFWQFFFWLKIEKLTKFFLQFLPFFSPIFFRCSPASAVFWPGYPAQLAAPSELRSFHHHHLPSYRNHRRFQQVFQLGETISCSSSTTVTDHQSDVLVVRIRVPSADTVISRESSWKPSFVTRRSRIRGIESAPLWDCRLERKCAPIFRMLGTICRSTRRYWWREDVDETWFRWRPISWEENSTARRLEDGNDHFRVV